MKTRLMSAALAVFAMVAAAGPALADEMIDDYVAYIGDDDLYNSSGDRLTQPWQVIRQDRANFHRFGISHEGDEGDRFFASAKNRDRMERMVRSGRIERAAGRAIVAGDVFIVVEIYRGPDGDYVNVVVQ